MAKLRKEMDEFLFAELKAASFNGAVATTPGGTQLTVFPVLHSVVGDNQELNRVTATRTSACVCCLRKWSGATAEQLVRDALPYRTCAGTDAAVAGTAAGKREAGLIGASGLLSGWRQCGDAHGNTYRSVVPDRLHNEEMGVWRHFVEAIPHLLRQKFPNEWKEKVEEINERLVTIGRRRGGKAGRFRGVATICAPSTRRTL